MNLEVLLFLYDSQNKKMVKGKYMDISIYFVFILIITNMCCLVHDKHTLTDLRYKINVS